MHVPDHFLTDPASITTAVLATAGVAGAALAARRATGELPGQRVTPVAVAATTALVFGLQMVNYPVAAGTSGHLLGGALAAALLGPAWGVLSITAVLAVQSLVFADGGLTALGTNVLLMALVGTLVGWWVSRLVARRVGASVTGARAVGAVAGSAALGALVSVVAAAGVFTALFALGGTVPVSLGALAGQMLGVHALIGLGEAAITAGVVALVAAAAPGWSALDPRAIPETMPSLTSTRRATATVGAVAVVAAAVLAQFASSAPDGLEASASAVGFAGAARDHAFAALPLADYGAATGLWIGLIGLAGLAACAAVAFAAARLIEIGRLPTPAQA
jgi:cobalt/nickel transport system permease protein